MIRTLQGFRDFIMRGNVIDLAVGIVIGAAFGSLVSTVTDKLLTPLIRAIGGGGDFAGTWTINGQHVDWAAFINALIAFVITSAVLYFLVVMPMNRLAERRRKGESPPPSAPSEEVLLLTQIRDALVGGEAVPRPRTADGSTRTAPATVATATKPTTKATVASKPEPKPARAEDDTD